MNNLIYLIKEFVFSLPGFKNIRKYRAAKYSQRRRNLFCKNSINAIIKLEEILRTNNIPYNVVFGTMLGAVREKGFIKNDLDIDIAIWHDEVNERLTEILQQNGCHKVRSIKTDNGDFGMEETYSILGVNVDFFHFYKTEENELPYTCVYIRRDAVEPGNLNHNKWMPIQLFLPMSREITYTQFESIQVPIPVNAIEFLEARYGQNWRTPDPTFVYPKMGDVKCAYRTDKTAVYKKY